MAPSLISTRLQRVFVFLILFLLSGCGKPTGYVSFQPSGIPMSITVDSKGKVSFSIAGEVTYPTPLGTFAVGVILNPAEHFDVANTLVVRTVDQEDQIYDLHGYDFNISFEPGYYRQISLYKDGQNLYLEIEKVDSEAISPEVASEPTQILHQQAPPGSYPINQDLVRDNQWIVTLTEIEILDDGKLIVNIAYRNNYTETSGMGCSKNESDDARANLVLSDGTRIFPVETFCTSRRGEVFQLAPGETFFTWAIFPPLEDATAPFDVSWYNAGEINNIVLVK